MWKKDSKFAFMWAHLPESVSWDLCNGQHWQRMSWIKSHILWIMLWQSVCSRISGSEWGRPGFNFWFCHTSWVVLDRCLTSLYFCFTLLNSGIVHLFSFLTYPFSILLKVCAIVCLPNNSLSVCIIANVNSWDLEMLLKSK